MTKFTYTAKNKEGKAAGGTVEASDKAAALSLLEKQYLTAVSLHEEKTGFDPNNLNIGFLKSKKVKTKDMVIFSRQLSTMVNAGVPLVRSLNTLKSQTKSLYFQEVITGVAKDVESGTPLADSLQKYPRVFSDVYINMVRAGEAAGILDEILKRLAVQQEKEATIKKKIKSASMYPMVLLVITTVAFFALMIFIVPKIGDIVVDLAGEDTQLPPYTRAMLALSDFMVNQWYFFMAIIFGGIFSFRRYTRTKNGKRQWHKLLLKMPIVSGILTKIAVARFARTFASLLGAGVGVLDSIHITGRAVGNVIIKEELDAAAEQVKNGKQLSEPLSNSQVFPPIVAQMLSIGEESGKTDEILLKVADFYEEEVDAVIDGLSSIIEPIMIVILGAMVGLIAASVMGPISELSQNI